MKNCVFIFPVFIALSACIAVQLGYYPTWMFFQCFCAMTLFYCAHWQTYVSGKKFIDVNKDDFIKFIYFTMLLILNRFFKIWQSGCHRSTIYYYNDSPYFCNFWATSMDDRGCIYFNNSNFTFT